LRITASDCLKHGIADGIVEEPASGAHRDWDQSARALGAALEENLSQLKGLAPKALEADRYDRFRKLGAMAEA
jgi:acetyl-CoA carboxylase alpha subunit